MVSTRSNRATTKRKRVLYRKHGKTSRCRGLGRATCRRTTGCKRANGSKRSFCRKNKNHHFN